MNREHEKTVLIPIRMENGRIRYRYGGPLPCLKDGTVGELSVPREKVLDARHRTILEHEEAREFLAKGTVLLAQISPREENPPAEHLKPFIKKPGDPQGSFVALTLDQDLKIRLRGTKLGNLGDCSCFVQALPEREDLESLNQAYTAITEAFEPYRKSRGGNVFLMLFAEDGNKGWQPLGFFRDRIQAQYEEELKLLNQWWWFRKRGDLFKPEWALARLSDGGQCVVRCFRYQDTVCADFHFSGTSEAVQWLSDNGYAEYQFRVHSQYTLPQFQFD